jgi:hypothetical protein
MGSGRAEIGSDIWNESLAFPPSFTIESQIATKCPDNEKKGIVKIFRDFMCQLFAMMIS